MSNALAVAAVSATLRDEITNAFVTAGIDLNAPIGNAQAFVGQPGRTHAGAQSGVDIFLYRVGPNPNLANCDMPTRTSGGALVDVPTAALTLWYLMTFFGDPDQLLPEQLLGVVTARLRAQPILTPMQISAATTAAGLALADLHEQPEYVRLRPVPLSDDEMNRIWSMLPTDTFGLSVVYEAAVVLVEADATPADPMLVTDRGIVVVASGLPAIAFVGAVGAPQAPIIAGATIALRGRNLAGPALRVELDGAVLPANTVTVLDPNELRVTLPNTTRPGAHNLVVAHSRPTGVGVQVQDMRSADAPFLVRPVVSQVTKPAGFVQALLTTAVVPTQHLQLVFNEVNTAQSLVLPATLGVNALRLRVPIADVPNGTYVVRARVDGASSIPTGPPNAPLSLPSVTVP